MAFELDASDAIRGIIRIAEFPDLARPPLREALQETADQLVATAAASISRQVPPRSLPGEPPGRESGALIRSLRTRLMPSKKRGELAYAIAGAEYGFMLESGTRNRAGQRIAPRPFMVPAARQNVANFVARVEAAIERAAAATNR